MAFVNEDRDEHVSQFLYRAPTPPPKPTRYTSRFSNAVRAESKSHRAERPKTMGPPEEILPEPSDFLKKGNGPRRPAAAPSARNCLAGKRPPIPARVQSAPGRQPPQFVQQNIKSAKGARCRAPERYLVDSPAGHKSRCDDSELRYVRRRNFGEVPFYLVRRRRIKAKTEGECRRRLEETRPLCEMIGEDERRRLLEGLKENWNQTQKELLCLPLVIDMITNINKKIKVEKKLKELEECIKFVESNPYIYVYDE